MTEPLITGIHHVTALSADPQLNLEFYGGILGLRLVKKTINFDAPEVYHLYYGNEQGAPGTILTFFPYPGLQRGKKGKGQLITTSFSVPEQSLDYWITRFNQYHVRYEEPENRFEDELSLYFEDHEGLGLELVANRRDDRATTPNQNIPKEKAIRGFYGITLAEEGYEQTAHLLTAQMNHHQMVQKGNRTRYAVSEKPGSFVDLLCTPDLLRGSGGAGTVHHVAFATGTELSQLEAREKLLAAGLNVTPVLNREYFHSIYFREPGGVLFEIATLPPGFTVDEDLDHLGETLKLPPWEERHRQWIEKELTPIHLNLRAFQ